MRFAYRTERGITHIFHRSEEEWKVWQGYVTNLRHGKDAKIQSWRR
jgi:hypothetical protein